MLKIASRCTFLIGFSALALAPAAGATIGAPAVIDGPAAEVGALGGVAQADDGTGGATWLRAVDGRQHVFAARFDGRGWSAPQRLDVTLPFDAAWPRIAAGENGRLVVVWAQHTAQGVDVLYSSALSPRSTRFQPPTVVDFALGGDDAVWPSVAMNAGGDAIVAYRAIPSQPATDVPPGYMRGTVRVARFDGTRWARVGTPVNRNTAQLTAAPTAGNAPQAAIDSSGNGVVAWQEPDDNLVPRVWARRVFGTRLGIVLAASPSTIGGVAQTGGADQPAVADTPIGRIVVGYRQLPDPKDHFSAPKLYVTQMQQFEKTFAPPVLMGDGGDASPSLGVSDDTTTAAYPRGGAVVLADAPKLPGDVAEHVQDAALAAPAPVLAAGTDGRAVLATAGEGGGGEVAVRELDGAGLVRRVPLSAAAGGPVRELDAAGDGNGDALVAFGQGTDDFRSIAVALVNAPPGRFALDLPDDWTRARRPQLAWTAATDPIDQVVYTVSVDGRKVGTTRALGLRLKEGALGQGTHTVSVVATDTTGQSTTADPESYKLDRQAPTAAVTVGRKRKVTVRLTDRGAKGAVSGVDSGSTSVAWGDGRETDGATRNASHTYKKPGKYTISISGADAAGNRLAERRAIRVR